MRATPARYAPRAGATSWPPAASSRRRASACAGRSARSRPPDGGETLDRFRLLIGNKNSSSWSLRPWLLLRQAGVAFEEELIPFGTEGWKERVRKTNPAGQVPALVHEPQGAAEPIVVWESLAICDYVARLRPEARLWPGVHAALAYCLAVSAEMHSGFRRLRDSMPMNVRKSLPGRGRGRQPGVAEDIARIAHVWRE